MSAEPFPNVASLEQARVASSLSSRRGIAILLLLSLVQFMDVLDGSILNIALPSIKNDLGFSQQGLQWVVSGYILTYGGFLLLGSRMADLLGRRLMLITGLVRSRLVAGRRPSPHRRDADRRPLRPRARRRHALTSRTVDADEHLPFRP